MTSAQAAFIAAHAFSRMRKRGHISISNDLARTRSMAVYMADPHYTPADWALRVIGVFLRLDNQLKALHAIQR